MNGRTSEACCSNSSAPESRSENPFIDSFNGKLRDECLNTNQLWLSAKYEEIYPRATQTRTGTRRSPRCRSHFAFYIARRLQPIDLHSAAGESRLAGCGDALQWPGS